MKSKITKIQTIRNFIAHESEYSIERLKIELFNQVKGNRQFQTLNDYLLGQVGKKTVFEDYLDLIEEITKNIS